jgi:hypothetical protein
MQKYIYFRRFPPFRRSILQKCSYFPEKPDKIAHPPQLDVFLHFAIRQPLPARK